MIGLYNNTYKVVLQSNCISCERSEQYLQNNHCNNVFSIRYHKDFMFFTPFLISNADYFVE